MKKGHYYGLLILLGSLLFIGGCSYIDYRVFRAKWPERSLWIWVWSGSKG
jgi:hypothetical protein